MGVPLAPICEAYFEYLIGSSGIDLDEAAAALAALAFLLERKAWGLLPSAEPEPESEEALELPSPSVGRYAEAIEALQIWGEARSKLFFRTTESGPDPYEVPIALSDVTSGDLAQALARVLERARPDEFRPLGTPRKSLAEQMVVVMGALKADWLALDVLVPCEITRSEAVYWFLALLELLRLGQAALRRGDKDVEFARAA